MAKAIIFDMDGTLFQTDRILEISLNDTFQTLKDRKLWEGNTPIEEYRRIMGVPLSVVWETLLPKHSQVNREWANDYFHERLIENIRQGKGALYPNVKEIFTFIKEQGFLIFIASNGIPIYLSEIISYYGLEEWITEVFSIQQIESKDKALLVKEIINKYNVTSGAVVGDRLSDIQAAKNNNLLSVGCRFDFAQEEELMRADVVIEDLLQLMQLFKEEVVK